MLCPPFAGDAGAELEAVEVGALMTLAARLAAGEVRLDSRLGWDGEACASVEALGFTVTPTQVEPPVTPTQVVTPT
ncbi:hypothetical protein BE11_24210 [Sorangium cellulosum]|nr:hypothetical protein BE11_24210 [Sorangium cellulosum]